VFLRRGQTNTMFNGYKYMHTRILANIYFISGYLTSIAMFFRPELYLKLMSVFIFSYLSYLLADQLETKK